MVCTLLDTTEIYTQCVPDTGQGMLGFLKLLLFVTSVCVCIRVETGSVLLTRIVIQIVIQVRPGFDLDMTQLNKGHLLKAAYFLL